MHVAKAGSGLILDVLTSQAFKWALSRVGRRTHRTGHETSFPVMKKYDSRDFGVPCVTEGVSGRMYDKALGSLPEEIYLARKRRHVDLFTNGYALLQIHFHSTYGHLVRPSLGDLYVVHSQFIDYAYEDFEDCVYEHQYEVRTIQGIAQIDPQRNVELLLIQPLMPFCPGEGEEAIFEQLLLAASTSEIAKLLSETKAYRSQVVHFQQWQLVETDRVNLETFAFTPRPFGVGYKEDTP